MAMAIGMVLLGIALVVGGYNLTLSGNLMLGSICIVFGAAILVFSAIVIIIAKLYQRTSANEAFVRTGMGGRKVVLDGGCIVIPVVHRIVPVSLQTMKLEVERSGEDALITQDNLRCDIRGEFYIKVQAQNDDILNASRSLGDRSVNAAAVRDLVFEKLVSALRSVAATRNLAQLHTERDDFANTVSELVREDLKSNGLTLESVTISRLDQTNTERLSSENVFDAQGLRKIAEITQRASVEKNMYERDAQREIVNKNVDTKKQVLDLEKDQAEAEATQEAEVAKIRAERRQDAETYEIEQRRLVETTQIDKERQVQEATVERDLQVDLATQEAEKNLIAKEQERQTADITRNEAIQTADVQREREVEVAKRQQQIAVAEAEQQRASAEQQQLTAEAEREKAEQDVITVEEVARADREKQVQIILASQQAEQDQIKQQMEADIAAYKNAKVAEGEQEAATKLAQAIRVKAEAEKDAAQLAATGEEAKQMVPVNVEREQVSVEAQQVQDVEAARVQVLRTELSAKAEYDQISVELEKALAQISANKEVGVAFANSFGDAFSQANVSLYGEPDMLGTAMSAFTKAAGIGAFMDGAKRTLPSGTLEGGMAALQALFPQLEKAMDLVKAAKDTDEAEQDAPADEASPSPPPAGPQADQ